MVNKNLLKRIFTGNNIRCAIVILGILYPSEMKLPDFEKRSEMLQYRENINPKLFSMEVTLTAEEKQELELQHKKERDRNPSWILARLDYP